MRFRRDSPVFRYAILSDTHIRPRDESSSPWKTNLLANERARWVAHSINQENPDMVIHLGDIVHPVPHLATHGSASGVAREIMGEIDASVVYVSGNHDVGDKVNPTVPAHTVNDGFIEYFRGHYGPTYQGWTHKGVRFISINSSALNSGLEEERAQKRWLEEELENHRDMRVHMFSHYPPYLYEPGEDSNYDNLDMPMRAWLLGLIEKYSVEAVFAGHVHHFFYKKHKSTDIYNLFATGNLRQDYSNLFRVDPGAEFGRDDNAKLGYCVVDVYEDGHVARFRRSYGATLEEGEKLEHVKRVPDRSSGRIGVHIRYPLGEVVTLPYMGPLDEFARKRARNDYPLLALWESGVGTLRVPIGDLLDDATRELYASLKSMRYKFDFFSVGVPDVELVKKYRGLVDLVEVITPWSDVGSVLVEANKLRCEVGVPVYLANIMTSLDREQGGGKFSHFMGYGFRVDSMDRIETVLGDLDDVDGFVFEVGENEAPYETVSMIHEFSSSHGFKALVNVRLAPEDPAVYPRDDLQTANRVAETVLAAHCFPEVSLMLDTFMDHDRGYFPRTGLYDRLLNPRKGVHVLHNLDSYLTRLSEIRVISKSEADGWRRFEVRVKNSALSLRFPLAGDCGFLDDDGDVVDLVTGELNSAKELVSQFLII